MEILLKKYFWVVNLVVIGICAGFAGRAAGHILEGAYLAGDDVKAPLRHTAPPPLAKLHDKNGDIIVSRDVFCSGCVPPKPTTTTERRRRRTSGPSRRCSSSWCRRWSARATTTTRWRSSATCRRRRRTRRCITAGRPSAPPARRSYRVLVEARVHPERGTARVSRARRHRAAGRGGRERAAAGAAASTRSSATSTRASTAPATHCTVDRALVEKLLSNTTMLATAARFVPSIKDGKPNGFKLYAIRPQSIFGTHRAAERRHHQGDQRQRDDHARRGARSLHQAAQRQPPVGAGRASRRDGHAGLHDPMSALAFIAVAVLAQVTGTHVSERELGRGIHCSAPGHCVVRRRSSIACSPTASNWRPRRASCPRWSTANPPASSCTRCGPARARSPRAAQRRHARDRQRLRAGDADAGLLAYMSLRNETRFAVRIVRRGQPQTLSFEIR